MIDSLNDPKEFDQLIKIVEMDKKPLHVQRFKKALLQYSTQNITSHHNQQHIAKEFQSNNIYTNQEGSSLNIDNNNNNMFTNSNWCSLVPSIYSGLNLFPNQSSLINSLTSTQSILSNYSQNFNPLFNQWAILNNSQNAPMFQSLAMGISNQQHLITPVESVDRNDHSFSELYVYIFIVNFLHYFQ